MSSSPKGEIINHQILADKNWGLSWWNKQEKWGWSILSKYLVK